MQLWKINGQAIGITPKMEIFPKNTPKLKVPFMPQIINNQIFKRLISRCAARGIDFPFREIGIL
jgi:hypothetical protein